MLKFLLQGAKKLAQPMLREPFRPIVLYGYLPASFCAAIDPAGPSLSASFTLPHSAFA